MVEVYERGRKFSRAVGIVALVVAACLMAGCSGGAPAQNKPKEGEKTSGADWPTKPIQCIVPWAAGGSSDMSQRMVASLIQPHLGTSMVVVNKPGGGSIPGTAEIAKAPADGYTIGQVWYATFALRPYVVDVPYKTEDYEFILGMVRQRNVIAVRADSPYKTLDDLIKAAKANPGKLTYGSPGAASWQHMAGVHFCKVAGIQCTHVPYDGGRPATVALMGGHIDFLVGQPPEFVSEYKAGQIRV
ncbi:MAG: tripartite tricarboxylate transporter substrate binding protein, partial [Thermoleophilia bacterium]|nr:tripartite tricarboxylate transporter substrate binding protein [Thermoleophilia bacterium]